MKVDQNLLMKKTEWAINTFKGLECDSLHDVDIEKCITDYVNALFIYDGRIVKTTPNF